MPVFARGPRPVLTEYDHEALIRLYTDLVDGDLQIFAWACAQVVAQADSTDRATADALLRGTRSVVAEAKASATRRAPTAQHLRLAAGRRVSELARSLREQAKTTYFRAVLDMLCLLPQEVLITALETRFTAPTMAADLVQEVYGVAHPSCASLLAAMSNVADEALHWLHTQLRAHPTGWWATPALIDVAWAGWWLPDADVGARVACGRPTHPDAVLTAQRQLQPLIDMMLRAPLNPAQADVAFQLAYDGGIDLVDLVAVVQQLA
jgi:hypothetical protein